MRAMDAHPIDLGHEILVTRELAWNALPVVILRPVADQLLTIMQRNALLPILNRFGLRKRVLARRSRVVNRVCMIKSRCEGLVRDSWCGVQSRYPNTNVW